MILGAPKAAINYVRWILVAMAAIAAGIILYFFGSLIWKASDGFYNALKSVFGGFIAFLKVLEDNSWLVWAGIAVAVLIPLAGYSYKAFSYLKKQISGVKKSGVTGKTRLAVMQVDRYNAKMGDAYAKYKGNVDRPGYIAESKAFSNQLQKRVDRLKLNQSQRGAYNAYRAKNPVPKWPK